MPSPILNLLGIDRHARYLSQPPSLASRAPQSPPPPLESEPTVPEYLRALAPTRSGAAHYARSLIPSATWIGRYNLRWLLGDCIAGLTIGFVVVPQAMAYALLAGLSPEYGLYTSFVGAAIYWVFGTSRDIVIGVCFLFGALVEREGVC